MFIITINTTGSSSCLNCGSEYGNGFTSSAGSYSCSICDAGYYRTYSDDVCVLCPSNTICSNEPKAIYPAPAIGYWIDTSNELFFNENKFQVYKCFRPTCKGSSPYDVVSNDDDSVVTVSTSTSISTVTGNHRKLLSSSSSGSRCWSKGNITNCNSDLLQCTEGAMGPLCGIYIYILTHTISCLILI